MYCSLPWTKYNLHQGKGRAWRWNTVIHNLLPEHQLIPSTPLHQRAALLTLKQSLLMPSSFHRLSIDYRQHPVFDSLLSSTDQISTYFTLVFSHTSNCYTMLVHRNRIRPNECSISSDTCKSSYIIIHVDRFHGRSITQQIGWSCFRIQERSCPHRSSWHWPGIT